MSPNPDAAEEELPFSEGQILRVYGDKDADGFYRGESGGRLGYVPCNMVSEIQVEDEETRQQLLQQGFLSTATSMEKIDPSQTVPAAAVGKPTPGARRMVAIFDYDPRESSPNTDIEAELTFSAGDIIHVLGDMDEDGFFYVSLERKPQDSGPSTLEESLPPQTEPACPGTTECTDLQPQLAPSANSTSELNPAAAKACGLAPDPRPADSPAQADCSVQGKKKKSFFSKGKKLFKKLGSSKKE
uniref:SH3 domain-containing protein n=1 Tax=Amphilophus citrinellus TaxID=61819 RepID=A0A3Q0RTA9_AMPCI